MRFADIACGSGSFLLGIYDLLLRHHGNYYNGLPAPQRAKAVENGECIDREGKFYVSLQKKREILLNNIFGVDLDYQAVQVAQLSLYLKLLEEETIGSARQYLIGVRAHGKLKKLLPDLGQNIVCGNSLIDWDIIKTEGLSDTEALTLRPLDFAVAFRNTMKEGGFDALVGNPPYGAELSIPSQHYLRANLALERRTWTRTRCSWSKRCGWRRRAGGFL